MIRFELLGGCAVIGPDARSVRVRGQQPALTLARLALDRPRPLTRDELAELLWPGAAPAGWEGPARQVVSRARAALRRAGAADDFLHSEAGRITLDPAVVVTTDVDDALDALDTGRGALDAGRLDEAAAAAAAVIGALRLPFFPSSDTIWVEHWRLRLRDARTRALHVAAQTARRGGDADVAIEAAEEALAIDPFDEVATRLLMAAHEARGSRAQALAAYERCRRLLDDELGVRPAEQTEQAYVALLGRAPAARPDVAALERVASGLPFVGRRSELERLAGLWQGVEVTGGAVAVIRGESGIGKTRLARELASLASIDDALVLWGDCVPDVGLAFQPFTSMLAQLVAERPEVLGALGSLVDDLAQVVPGIERSPRRLRADDEHRRTRAFRAVAAAFDVVASQRVLLVLDDLQWAGEDALALARHLAPALAERPWLLCVTARRLEGAVAATIADLGRRVPATDVALAGLDEADLAEVLELAGLGEPDHVAALAAGVARRTAGNPFFVSQLVDDALLRRAGIDVEGVPGAVAQHVVRRVEALDRPLGALLAIAAVAGGDVNPAVLEACASEPDQVLDRLDELTRERFLEERAPDRFGFAHAIVRDAVLATVSATRRRRLHGRVGDALADAGAEPSVVAHHYLSAGPERAVDATAWLCRAGDRALGHGAWSIAGEHFSNAASCATGVDERVDAMVGLGRAQRALGDVAASRATLDAALEEARAHGRGRGAAQAILALVGGGGRGVAVDLADAQRRDLWQEALAGLAPGDPLLVPVLAGLALSLVLTDAAAERAAICARCVDEARTHADPELLAIALQSRRVALMGPAGTLDRVRDRAEILAFARGDITVEARLGALLGQVEDGLELGDRPSVDGALAAATEDAEALAHPYWSWATTSWRGLVALVDGELGRAEELALAAFGHQAPAHHPEAEAALGVNLVAVRVLQGRAGEVVEALDDAATANPQIPAYRVVHSLCSAAAGDLAGAAAGYRSFAAHGFTLPADSNWLLGCAGLAEVAVALEDGDGAARVGELLAPFADRHVVLNCYGGGGAYWGPVSYQLARISSLRGDRGAARVQAQRAVDLVEALGARSFRARCEGLRRRLG